RAAQHVEARARELCPARDVEDAERLAELPVRLRREGELLRLVLTDDDVIVLVLPLRYPRVDDVRDPESFLVALGLERAELGVDLLDLLPHLAHPRLHRVGPRAALARLVPPGAQRLLLRAQRSRPP